LLITLVKRQHFLGDVGQAILHREVTGLQAVDFRLGQVSQV
jgi:hypothetical protein